MQVPPQSTQRDTEALSQISVFLSALCGESLALIPIVMPSS